LLGNHENPKRRKPVKSGVRGFQGSRVLGNPNPGSKKFRGQGVQGLKIRGFEDPRIQRFKAKLCLSQRLQRRVFALAALSARAKD
jgi:hypothetical protein